MKNRFQELGELLQHKATSQGFSHDDDDDLYDDDVLRERCQPASRGAPQAL